MKSDDYIVWHFDFNKICVKNKNQNNAERFHITYYIYTQMYTHQTKNMYMRYQQGLWVSDLTFQLGWKGWVIFTPIFDPFKFTRNVLGNFFFRYVPISGYEVMRVIAK